MSMLKDKYGAIGMLVAVAVVVAVAVAAPAAAGIPETAVD